MIKGRAKYLALLFLSLSMIVFIVLDSKSEAPSSEETNTDTTNNSDSTTESNDTDTQQSGQDENQEPSQNDDEQVSTKKPILSGNVTSKPIVSSSYGLVEDKPVPKSQIVSTSCATAQNVECQLVATNKQTGEIVKFDVLKTDSTGAAIWEWTGGKELSSGTWETTVHAGDKISDIEVIYVQ